MNYPRNILEEELKNRLSHDFFSQFDCTKILGKIDYAVKLKRPAYAIDFADEYLLWAEAKKNSKDVVEMLTQLVLTIGKAKTFNEYLPPAFLGCFDSEKIAFIPYYEIQDIFYQNDFNWNVTSSNKDTREFKLVYAQIQKILDSDIPFQTYLFDFEKDENELRRFIRENFVLGKADVTKIEITANNVVHIFHKWVEKVKPTIEIDWKEEAYQYKVYERDFFLADLISDKDETIDNLTVKLRKDYYKTEVSIKKRLFLEVAFKDGGKAYREFWAKYSRPPRDIYRKEIKARQDLLVLPSFRERKGAFFTPPVWVEKSQEYLAKVFGENWQDEYYIWDCAAGTGNLLQGLTKPYRIFASTLDSGDVKLMHDDIDNHRSALLKEHTFQFDFLNDSLDALQETLRDIINDEKRRKNLIVYINPPYVEGDAKIGRGRRDVQISKMHDKYKKELGKASSELFAQFYMRIYKEINGCVLAVFSPLKPLQAPNFKTFRDVFLAKLEKIFLLPAFTFDNVQGHFPISFSIWNTDKKERFKEIKADVFNEKNFCLQPKKILCYDDKKYISDWLVQCSKGVKGFAIGHLASVGNDFQHQKDVYIDDVDRKNIAGGRHTLIYKDNLIVVCIYLTVRKSISGNWLNQSDQFLFPNKKWEKDTEFHNNCLAYTLFNNNISSKYGINHWIPFAEEEVKAKTEYKSHIILSFLNGKKIKNAYTELFDQQEKPLVKRQFSPSATAVFDAGRERWKYYHQQPDVNVNASLYDIREHFPGRNEKGKMNSSSTDERYNDLIANLRDALDALAKKIEPKVYEYEFLLR